ncbi:hypothetical protein [Azonexus sp. R2A61]|uniref:hypothetical protein n=1 Tax=Azonexus sp. R2A61 TaxID=2744443 RepID=UPI001F249601|nr:hypothetical protein [Azonexus sp. R2A61]
MDRITTSTKATDLFGEGKHGFRDGNRAAAIPATDLSAAFMNDLQEEICNVIESAGYALVAGDRTQLRQAIAKMIQSGQRSVIIGGATFAAGVATGDVVYWDAADNRFDKAMSDGSAKQNAVGVADIANAQICAFGDAVLFAGLTPGARYYLDPVVAGAITTVAPANGVYIGIARNATEIFVDIDGLNVQSNQSNVFTKGQSGAEVALPTTIGTVTLDLSQGNNWGGTLTGNIILANPSSMPVGQSGVIRLVNDATPRAIAYGSYWKAAAGSLPALTSSPTATDDLVYYVESATRIVVAALGDTK